MKQYVFEVLEEMAKQRNRNDKVRVLKENETWALKDIIRGSMDSTIKWNLPEGEPPYKPAEGVNEDGEGTDLEGALIGKMRMMKYFISVDGNVLENIKPAKREVVFIQLLETIAPKDAKLVLEMKSGAIKGVSTGVVEKAFPQIQTK